MAYTPRKIFKVLVANRGEIAVRIIQAAHELNMQAVAIYTDADAGNLACQLADESYRVGENLAYKSYLNIENVLKIAKEAKVDAIHPGYGFLSENALFAQKVEEAGIIFVGPSSATIATMGDKAKALEQAKKSQVPTMPSTPVLQDLKQALEQAQHIGYPLLIKAIAGGGGKGIRFVENEKALKEQFSVAVAEATSAFGNGGVYLEKYLDNTKHIEVQVLGDGENVIHLYDRECSMQRRRQKVLEEAPSPSLDDQTREALCACAVRMAKQVGYKGAGTLEFLYDSKTKGFYFLEMNTRIQVEHAITEMVTGVDLVRQMLRIADGEPLGYQQEDISLRGHSIEVRINAEDPQNNFFPSPGQISKLQCPTGSGIRLDSMLFSGRTIPPFYDSLVAKLIVYDQTRPFALSKLKRALGEFKIEGVKTTIGLFKELIKHERVQKGDYSIHFLEDYIGGKHGV
ncbi:acetyl-CoA carboxylase biotin carboxylase subunit [Helicobacter ailurogastricus]|uniref:biotin carboxylase n=1 Tax=Helicobacter ailurogastricus TaxID=1578720 RepID=A0A0K2XC72_9HELI|nr:acetyl-CoA carboxylase biotin carboxylase subunit [Helicobacter ailurogastricus]CRF40863.1 Biotin carboxylase of acetyl-CoA carboxylase [Helicobacter ailurogastricus]CRF42902.1 Biotin carboxylase of acetyl-CoA carboxylase [Helicobacter ailurogastricus]CRF43671.1 Biotin carboxylase of acetyl-CoA carboxylase [Helicobacter ailurogastricus]